jgi:hypothetical protein
VGRRQAALTSWEPVIHTHTHNIIIYGTFILHTHIYIIIIYIISYYAFHRFASFRWDRVIAVLETT